MFPHPSSWMFQSGDEGEKYEKLPNEPILEFSICLQTKGISIKAYKTERKNEPILNPTSKPKMSELRFSPTTSSPSPPPKEERVGVRRCFEDFRFIQRTENRTHIKTRTYHVPKIFTCCTRQGRRVNYGHDRLP